MRQNGCYLSIGLLILAGCSPTQLSRAPQVTRMATAPQAISAGKNFERSRANSDPDGPFGDSPDDAAEFLRMQRWQGPGDFPVDRYQKARDQVRRSGRISLESRRKTTESLAKPADTLGTGWQALGPGNIGGRVRGIAIDPTNPAVIYAATATGGVWKTIDSGTTWLPLTDFLPVLSTSTLVMDPSTPTTLYLGTGEYQLWGNGIYKTTDGGATWNELPATDNAVAFNNFRNVNQIAIPATRPTHLYAATSNGLFSSVDSGITWTQAISPPPGGFERCNSVIARGDQPTDIVYAACGLYTNGAYIYSIYRNMDAAGAGTWDVVQSDPLMSSTVLAIAASAPQTIYALSATASNSQGMFPNALYALFQSTSNGDTGSWVKRADTTNPNSLTANILSRPNCGTAPGTPQPGQANYDLTMVVDPTNPNTVFVGGIDLFRSDDGGLTFGYENEGPNFVFAHNDQHALAFHPAYDGKGNQTLFCGQ